MATALEGKEEKRKESAAPLPLGLQPYHVFYIAGLSAIVAFGTVYSVIHSTHIYNVSLSASVTQHPLRSTLDSNPLSQAPLVESARMPATIFANRANLINRIFIKRAWGWTSLAFAAQAFTLRAAPLSSSTSGSDLSFTVSKGKGKGTQPKRDEDAMARSEATIYSPLSRSTFRYIIATLLWSNVRYWETKVQTLLFYVITNSKNYHFSDSFFAAWFFGPPLMTRILQWSGAECYPMLPPTASSAFADDGMAIKGSVHPSFCHSRLALTPQSSPEFFQSGHAALASASSNGILKARFRGGHDISGHTYILVLSIMYLLEDLTPFLPHLVPLALHPYLLKIIPTRNWSARDPFRASDFISAQKATINLVVASSILALVGLWFLSLLNTALFFHTPQEKASGLIAGLLASFLLPKGG